MNKREVRSTPHQLLKRKQSHGVIKDLENVDLFPQTSVLLVKTVFAALDLWNLIVFVLGNTTQNHDRTGKPVVSDKNQRSRGMTNVLNNMTE